MKEKEEIEEEYRDIENYDIRKGRKRRIIGKKGGNEEMGKETRGKEKVEGLEEIEEK